MPVFPEIQPVDRRPHLCQIGTRGELGGHAVIHHRNLVSCARD
jgi:hypothetical protein